MVSLWTKFGQVRSIWRSSQTPIPLILDALRLKRRGYVARGKLGLEFELLGGRGEWFTFFENVIREDYFPEGVTLSAGDTVVDIGANLGTFALVAAKRVGSGGCVIAYEPDPVVFERLTGHVSLNGLSQVRAVNCAVAGSDGTLTLHRSAKNAWSTLYPQLSQEKGAATELVEVKVVSIGRVLAEIPGEVQLMKVDCEGAEYEIFDAMTAEEAGRIRRIVMEVHPVAGRSFEGLMARLRALGFETKAGYPVRAERVGRMGGVYGAGLA